MEKTRMLVRALFAALVCCLLLPAAQARTLEVGEGKEFAAPSDAAAAARRNGVSSGTYTRSNAIWPGRNRSPGTGVSASAGPCSIPIEVDWMTMRASVTARRNVASAASRGA